MTFFFRHHYFGHDFEHWPLANPYMVNAALQLKRLPTPGLDHDWWFSCHCNITSQAGKAVKELAYNAKK